MFGKNMRKSAQTKHTEAIYWLKQSKPIRAILLSSEACGVMDNCESRELLGHALSTISEHVEAGEQYRRARILAWGGSVFKKPVDPKRVAELYGNESLAYLRAGCCDIVQDRSGTAIELIELGVLPRYVTYGDCESWLRMNRCIALLQSKDSKLLVEKKWAVDLGWLWTNSGVSKYISILSPLHERHRDGISETLSLWHEYDRVQEVRDFLVND